MFSIEWLLVEHRNEFSSLRIAFEGAASGRITLAAIVRALKRKYHWPIETTSFPSNAADGRATWATVYSLPPEVIAKALANGGRDWLASRRAS